MSTPQTPDEALFRAAAELPASKRGAFLDAACDGDASLRSRLEARLATHDNPDSSPSPEAKPIKTLKIDFEDAPDEAIGQTLGRYKLLEKVGEGGCGVVYVAEQSVPVRRRVALKVIKLGMDTKAVVARFEAERQALAMMDHPNIAKVLDAGTTDVGRPFFVMELVRGIRITDYCDQNNLATKERLDLFIKVCQAIQHAHQKGIIHRDIKPSNILVTLHDGVPVPKVIDFGIAKATEGRLTDSTVYTQLHQFIGTPAYMSPEQAEMSGLDIDTRSDIYSLGVLLYELLVGSTPFDATELAASGIDAMRKTIREKEPVRPSTKLGTLRGEELTATAKHRSIETSKLANLLRGDLDWIVMKCLEKDRTRRYETANGVAMDLKRYLDNETVVARPPSSAYRFQKLVRRNKLAFAAFASVATALLLGIIATTVQSVRATRAKEEALSARHEAEANEQKAKEAQANEAKLREHAQAQELAARQRAYASDMNVAAQALAGNNLGQTLDLLNRQRPQPGQRDLRGWEWRYLWQQTHGDALFTLCKESGEINSLSTSSDGVCLAVSLYHKGGISIWDLRTRKELTRLQENEISVRAAFSPVEPVLAFTGLADSVSGNWKSTLHLWSLTTQKMIAEVPLEAKCVALSFSRDGKTLVTTTPSERNGETTLWRIPDCAKLASYSRKNGTQDVGTGFSVTSDLKMAAYESEGGQMHVIDLQNGKELWAAAAAKAYVTALAFSPDEKILASGAGFAESDIRLWDVGTGKEIGRLQGHGSWISSLVFWPDGKKLASSSADQTIRIWDVESRKCLDVLHGNRQEVWRLALLPDDKTLVSGAKDGTVCLWDTASGLHLTQPRIALADKATCWLFTSDSRSVLVANKENRVSRWSGADFQQHETLIETGVDISNPAFSPDGRLFAALTTNGLRVWDVLHGEMSAVRKELTGKIAPISFLDDGRKLITFSFADNVLHEVAVATGMEIQSWPAPASFQAFGLRPGEQECVALGYEGEANFRNLTSRSNEKLDIVIPEPSWANFSPDGKLFTVSSLLGYTCVWNAFTWKPVTTLGGLLNGANMSTFSPDGKRLAVSSLGKEALKLYDPESWQNVLTLECEGNGNPGAAFSPDGNSIGWMNDTGGLFIWRAPSWEEINAAETKENSDAHRL
ncbi:MAG TPA: protein kinase [Verrucomicrobiae bacterium]|jgi:serine/threonine protein kinase/WD40 repeat protein